MFRGAGDGTCTAGGWASCPEGSSVRDSRWGCEAIVPATACTGANRDAYGSASCVPIGDCGAAFPPANATLFVDAASAVDATHFTRINDALAAASAGAVIAIAPGTYPESLVATKDLTLVGRCAAKVSIVGAGSSVRGLRVEEGVKVTARGLTITKQFIGVSVGVGASLTLSDSVVEANSEVGISLSEGVSTFTGERLAVRDNKEGSAGTHGWGLNAQAGATVTVTDSAFSGNHYANVRLSTKSSGTFERIVLRDGKPTTMEDVGRGISVQQGATAKLTRAALVGNYEIGIVAADATTIELEEVLVGSTKLSKSGAFGRALDAFGGAQVHAKRFHAYDNHDASVIAVEPGTHVTLEASSIVDTAFERSGLLGRAIGVQQGATVDVTDSAIVNAREVAVGVFDRGSHVTLSRSVVIGTQPNGDAAFGHGVMATFGSLVEIADSEIAENAGVGIAIGTASARVARVRIRKNAVGLYVQDGTTLREAADSVPGPLEVTVTSDTLFLDNATRFSAGLVPLPAPLAALAP